MKSIKKYLAVLISAVMVLSMTCCSNGAGQSDAASAPQAVSSAAEKDGFRFTDYQGNEIIEIQKVENGENLDSVCETYRFIFLSDGEERYKIKGYISIPLSCVEARQPCRCMVYCRGGNSNLGYLDKSLFRISPHASCLHIFRHILPKSSLIHKVLPAVLAASGEKSYGA